MVCGVVTSMETCWSCSFKSSNVVHIRNIDLNDCGIKQGTIDHDGVEIARVIGVIRLDDGVDHV